MKTVSTPVNFRKFCKVSELAKILGVHPNTIRRWRREGKVKAVRKGRDWLYNIEFILKELEGEVSSITGSDSITEDIESKSIKIKSSEVLDLIEQNKPAVYVLLIPHNRRSKKLTEELKKHIMEFKTFPVVCVNDMVIEDFRRDSEMLSYLIVSSIKIFQDILRCGESCKHAENTIKYLDQLIGQLKTLFDYERNRK